MKSLPLILGILVLTWVGFWNLSGRTSGKVGSLKIGQVPRN